MGRRLLTPKEFSCGERKLPTVLILQLDGGGLVRFFQSKGNVLGEA